MTRLVRTALLLALAALAVPALRADTVYSTVGDQNSEVLPFGAGSPTWGETFTAPGGNLLNFTFYTYSTGPTDVTAQVYAWYGSLYGDNAPQGTGGSALFSAPVTIANGNGALTATTVTIGGDGLPLTAGDNYIILFTDPDNYNNLYWSLDTSNPTPSSLGGFNFTNADPADFDLQSADYGTLEYIAVFGPASTPEPTSFVLLGTALLGAGAMLRRRVLAS